MSEFHKSLKIGEYIEYMILEIIKEKYPLAYKVEGYFTGLGYWTRANPEMCLLATKGKPKRISKSVRQLVMDKRREHSRKPDRIRNDIVELCGDLPRIELFARQRVDGWDNWGNQV